MLAARISLLLVWLSLAVFAELSYPAGLTVREVPFATLKPWLERSDFSEARLGGERLALRLQDRLEVFSLGSAQPLSKLPCSGNWELTPDGQSVAVLGSRLELRDALTGKLRWKASAPRGELFCGRERGET